MKFICVASLLAALLLSALPALGQEGGSCMHPANAVVAENCQAGDPGWYVESPNPAVEVFVFPPSVDLGETANLYVNSQGNPVDVRVFRLGYYDGAGARLVTEWSSDSTPTQPACQQDLFETGLVSCLNWTPQPFATSSTWTSGVYSVQVTDRETGGANQTAFVIRDDSRDAPLLFQQSNFTFQAYNDYGGKSVYNYNSGWDAGYCNTVSGHPRAVSVSLGRPYAGGELNNPYDNEFPLLRWLEQQGYDVSYTTDWDVNRWGGPGTENELLDHDVFMSAGHNEYWTQAQSDAVFAARDAGVDIAFFSANTSYWRVRLEQDPWQGVADSVITVYKTAEDGQDDPSGHATTTFRSSDIGAPENALIGTMYVGDNGGFYFPLRVTGKLAQDPAFRHTDLQSLEPEQYVDIGKDIVGWEWDAHVENGLTPSGLSFLASTPTLGLVLLDEGNFANGTVGLASSDMTRYVAESGAQVFSTGTILWGWGLGSRGVTARDTDPYLQQITVNVLADMGLQPGSPSNAVVLDGDSGIVSSDAHPVRNEGEFPPIQFANVVVTPDAGLISGGLSAIVSWTTDRPTRGQVWYGPVTGNTPVEGGTSAEYETEHAIRVDGLVPGSDVVFRIAAMDEQGNLGLSDEVKFRLPPNVIRAVGSPLLREWRSLECMATDYPWLPAVGLTIAGLAIVAVVWLLVRLWRWKHARPNPGT